MTLLSLWSTGALAGVMCTVQGGAEVDFDGLQQAVNNPLCLTIWLEGGETYPGFEAPLGLGRDLLIVSRDGVGTIEGATRLELPLADRESSLTFAHVRFEGQRDPIVEVRRPPSTGVVRFEDSELACVAAPCLQAEGAIVELARTSVQAGTLDGDALVGLSGARYRILDGSRLEVGEATNLVLVRNGSVEVRSGLEPVVFGPFPGTAIHADVEQCQDSTGCSVTVDGAWFVGVDGPAMDLSGVDHVALTGSQLCGSPDVALRLMGSCAEGCAVGRTAFGPDPASGVGATAAIVTDAPLTVDTTTFRAQGTAVVAAAPISVAVRGSVVFDGALAGGPMGEMDVSGSLVHEDVAWNAALHGTGWVHARFDGLAAPDFELEGRQCAEFRYHPRILVDDVEPPTWASRPFEAGVWSGVGPDDDEVAPWRFDCADAVPEVHALQVEPPLENGVDDDCDGLVDCDDPDLATTGGVVDEDGDDYGRPLGDDEKACVLHLHDGPDGDCDDADPSVHPGAEELCDELDRDCDGHPTEGATDTIAVWPDDDGDGFGDQTSEPVDACEADAATGDYATVPGDCDDGDGGVHPNEADLVNDGLDADCDGEQATALVGGGGCGCGTGATGGGWLAAVWALGVARRRRGQGASAGIHDRS